MSLHIDEIKNLGSMGYSYDGIQVEVEDGSSYVIRADTSDANLKKNIADSEVDALKVINAIEHKRFDFIKYEKHRECGYIAQQLETVNEEFVMDVEQGDGSIIKQVNSFELLSYATAGPSRSRGHGRPRFSGGLPDSPETQERHLGRTPCLRAAFRRGAGNCTCISV